MHCYPRMLTAARKIYFYKFVLEKVFLRELYVTDHLKIGPSGNS